jgi:RNA polymerase sigma-70 factor, ECF subfamily
LPNASDQILLEQLALQAQAGCSASFEELARRVSPTLLAFLRRRCPTLQDAEDVHQDTLLSAYQNLATYDPKRPFGPWLKTIATRLAVLRARKTRSPERLRDDVVDGRTNVDVGVAQRDAEEILWATAARTLSAAQNQALRLRHVEHLDIRGIAAAMGISRVRAKVLLFRARKRLMALAKVQQLLDEPIPPGEDHNAL